MSAPAKDAARAIAVRLATTKYAYDDSRIAAITQALRRYAKRSVAALIAERDALRARVDIALHNLKLANGNVDDLNEKLMERDREIETLREALRHAEYRTHDHSVGCDGCIKIARALDSPKAEGADDAFQMSIGTFGIPPGQSGVAATCRCKPMCNCPPCVAGRPWDCECVSSPREVKGGAYDLPPLRVSVVSEYERIIEQFREALQFLLVEVDRSGNGKATDFGWPVAVAKARALVPGAPMPVPTIVASPREQLAKDHLAALGEIDSLKARCARLVEALRPFALAAKDIPKELGDHRTAVASLSVKAGDFRAAARALKLLAAKGAGRGVV